jgi:hypothetical protein
VREHVAEAVANHTAAVAALSTAQQDHAAHVASAITGGSSPTATGLIRAARAHERDAEDELAAAKNALSSLEGDLVLAEADAAVAGKAVDRALAETLEPTLRRLMDEARAHRDSYLRAQVAMVQVAGLFDPWHPLSKESSFVGLGSNADTHLMDESRAKWEDALKTLRENADAELPATRCWPPNDRGGGV